MTLKAVLFDFNGVIINDEPIHEQLIAKLLIEENLRLNPGEFKRVCLGRSDRVCLTELLNSRGRVATEEYLMDLMVRKANAYRRHLETLEKLPIYPGLADLMFRLRGAQLKLAVVSGALRTEIELVLEKAQLAELNLQPSECLAIEDTPAGIQAAKRAGIPVVGVANTYPFHMMQRQANWAVDYLSDLELDRVQAIYAKSSVPKAS